ncbi:MAG: class I SAM-dependent methyltransferase [Candidatus ainarchaeum sp.]|nr:class I SAM-dependent methyltransferase [Candidatus ainarchaeum sp.]
MELFGLSLSVSPDVYEPAEDSGLLAFHSRNLKGRILEIGTGSGLASILNAKTNPSNEVLATDINPAAMECARKNAEANSVKNIHFLQSNLFEKVEGKFDHILFNPPYLPTSKDERIPGNLNYAFDGGEDGRKTLDKFLDEFDKFLAPRGTLLLVQSSLNSSEKTFASLQSKGFATRILEEQPFFFEIIHLLEAQRIM